MIEYRKESALCVTVYRDRKLVGTIRGSERGWQYVPKGKRRTQGGEYFETLSECKESL